MAQDSVAYNRRARQSLTLLAILTVGYTWLLIRAREHPPAIIHFLFILGIGRMSLDLFGWWRRRTSMHGESSSKAWEEDPPLRISLKGSDDVLGNLYFVETEDDYWWQALIGNKENPVKLVLAGEDEPDAAILKTAKQIVENWSGFLADIRTFLLKEAERDSANREDISLLKVQKVRFSWPQNPSFGEIIFADAPSGALWSCGYKNGAISGLSVSGR